jgi:Tfp pilus assembly PilM family ATPase
MSPSLFATPPPAVAIGISARHVSAVALGRHGRDAVITAHAGQALPPGVVVPSLNAPNVADPPGLAGAVGRILERLGTRARRVALVLPDTTAKVSLVRLDKVPSRADDLDQLIRWHVRKTAPFHVEDAQLAYSPATALADGGREFVVALARRDIVREYEAACEQAGAHAGLVDLATFSLVNGVLAGEGGQSGDWLLVHVTPDYGSIAILRGSDLIFFRNRAEGSDETLADLVHQTAMYYEDRLGGTGGFNRVVLAGSGLEGWGGEAGGLEAARRQVAERLRVPVQAFDPQAVARFGDRISADPALLAGVAPLVGVLVRQGRA